MAYYPMLTNEELIRHITTMYNPSELEEELAARIEKLLDEVKELSDEAQLAAEACSCGAY